MSEEGSEATTAMISNTGREEEHSRSNRTGVAILAVRASPRPILFMMSRARGYREERTDPLTVRACTTVSGFSRTGAVRLCGLQFTVTSGRVDRRRRSFTGMMLFGACRHRLSQPLMLGLNSLSTYSSSAGPEGVIMAAFRRESQFLLIMAAFAGRRHAVPPRHLLAI
jgi:hypothetical protein